MEMVTAGLTLLFLLMLMLSGFSGAQEDYPPECQSWDEINNQVRQNFNSIPSGSSTCTTRDDCTGTTCSITLLSKTFNVRMRLFPCDDPPQMRVLVDGSGVDFEETITHGSTYTLPGLQFKPIPFGPSTSVQLVVRFVPSEDVDGFVIGMDLKLLGLPLRYNLFNNVLIRTPSCTTLMPPDDCEAMQILSESIGPPHSCAVKTTPCDGIDCTGTYDLEVSLMSLQVKVRTGLRVLSCSTPISYELTAQSDELNLDWTHIFNESETVTVDQNLNYGADLVVSVTMIPQTDLENINTTINYTMTADSYGPFRESLLDRKNVPIPQCMERPDIPTPTEPPPVNHSECASWKGIENALEFQLDQYAIQDCVTIDSCKGFNCTATYNSDAYNLLIEEFHCEDPLYVLVTILGPGENFTQKFTHNETVPLDTGSSGIPVNVTVHLVPETPTSIYLGVYIVIVGPSGPVDFPLVEDQLLEVSECDFMTTTLAIETTKILAQGGGTSQTRSASTAGGATKRPGKEPAKHPGKEPAKQPVVQDQLSDPGIGVLWTILLAVFSAIIIATAVMAIFLFYRRRRRSNDMAFLMEDTGGFNDRFASFSS